MSSVNQAVALRARANGTEFYRNEDYAKAFANYLLAVNIKQEWRNDLEQVFTRCLCEWSNTLEKENKLKELFTCYEQALLVYPNSFTIVNNLAQILLRLEHYVEAFNYLELCLSLKPLDLQCYWNLESVSNKLVERWHYRMLNDKVRNQAYRRAIHSIVCSQDVVLDIGTGTSLLSLYASEVKCKHIYGCDYSQVMCKLAQNIVSSNHLSDRITIINQMSTSLQIPQHIPQKVSLIITETMDAGLLGEGLLVSLSDAWERLLDTSFQTSLKPRVVPSKAIIYIAPVESLELALKYKYVPSKSTNLRINANLSAYFDEPYDSENLKKIKFNLLSDPVKLLSINFTNQNEINDYLKSDATLDVKINSNKEGFLDAFITWFDLYLTENEILSTSPFSEFDSCWEQAIFPVKTKCKINNNTPINISMMTKGSKLTLIKYKVNNYSLNSYEISKELIRFLNDEKTLFKMNNIISASIKGDEFDILDLSVCPISCLNDFECKVTSVVRNELDLEFLRNYSVSNSKLGFELMSWEEFENSLEKKDKKYDLIILDILDQHGELHQSLSDYYHLICKSLKAEGKMFPREVKVQCQLVYSDWLWNNSRLNNSEITNSYNSFHLIDKYKVNHFIDLDLSKIDYKPMSEVLTIATFNIDDLFRDDLKELSSDVQAISSGSVNAIIYWFTFEGICSNTPGFHRNQSAQLLDNIQVYTDSQINLVLNYKNCIVKFHLDITTKEEK